ncbi:MAG: response regulator, partial [Chlorobi bacterium]|nr:response regulator [Chlorobiota bacterium]
MMQKQRTILIVDDDKGVQFLIKSKLEKLDYKTLVASSGAEALKLIKNNPHIFLCIIDYKLEDITGQKLATILQKDENKIPFIFITGFGNEKIAIEVMKLGAKDYLIKDADFNNKLEKVVENVSKQLELENALRLTQKALKESEQQFRELYEYSTMGIYRSLPNGQIILANLVLAKIFGFNSVAEIYAVKNIEEKHVDKEARKLFVEELNKKGIIYGFESYIYRTNGKKVYTRESARVVKDKKGRVLYYEGWMEDITDQYESRKREIEGLKNIQFLSETSLQFAELKEDENIYEFIGEKLFELIPFAVIFIYSINTKKEKAKLEFITGINKKYHDLFAFFTSYLMPICVTVARVQMVKKYILVNQ